jgi:lipoprotein-releasing system permease protein
MKRPAAAASLRTVSFLAVRHLWERRLLNGIAVGGVTLGVAVLIVMPALMAGYQVKFFTIMLKTSSHVVLNDTELRTRPLLLRGSGSHPVAAEVSHQVPSDRQRRIPRPHEIVGALGRLDGVDAAAASLAGSALVELGGKTKAVDLHGIDVEAQERVTPIAQFLQAGSFTALNVVPDSLAVGSGVAQELGLRVGDVVHAAAPGGRPMDLRIVAVFEVEVPPVDKSRAYTLLRTAQVLLGRPDAVSRIEVRLRDADAAVSEAARFERLFGYDAESWQEIQASFLGLFAAQNVVIAFVIGAILMVSGFGILSVLSMIALQKRRDLSILRSMGLQRLDVLALFLLQGLAIATVGAVLGEILGKLALWYIPTIRVPIEGVIKADGLPVHEDPRLYLFAAVFALVLGTLASLLPAWKASRVEPVEVLRGQIG